MILPISYTIRKARRVVALVLAVVASPALAGPTNVPFKATSITQERLVPDAARCPVTGLSGITTGSGHATYLGAITGIAQDCIALAPGTQPTFSNGLMTLTAASGDQLTISYDGRLIPTATPGIFTIAGSFRITGGTGRFDNASGGGTLSGIENLGTLQGRFDLNGTISY